MNDITLECVPQETTAPAGDLTSQALWYQQQLEALAPTRQYITYCYQQIESAWQLMQTRLLDIQRQLTEVKQLPPKAPRQRSTSGKRAKNKKALEALITSSGLTDEEMAKVRKALGL